MKYPRISLEAGGSGGGGGGVGRRYSSRPHLLLQQASGLWTDI